MVKSSYVRIDESRIWDDIISYFQNNGIEAFNHVPYLVTSSENLAKVYTNVISKLIDQENCHVFELGAGHGQFGYRLRNSLKPKHYHLVDCCEIFREFWLSHPNWKSDTDKFSTHIFEFKHPFSELEKSIASHNDPVVFVANYFFDSIPFRAFHKVDNQWHEIYIKNQNQKKATFSNEFKFIPVNLDDLEPYIRNWLQKTNQTTTTIPSVLNKFIDWCLTLNRPAVLIGSDFTPITNREMTPEMMFSENGCLTTSLNFEILPYIASFKTEVIYHESVCTKSLKSFVFGINTGHSDCSSLGTFSEANVQDIMQPLISQKLNCTEVKEIISKTQHDPWVFTRLFKPVLEEDFIPNDDLHEDIVKLAEKVYPMPEKNDWLMAAHILCKLGKPEKAIEYCQKHIQFYGEDAVGLRELGYAICLTGNRVLGIETLKKVLKKNSRCSNTLELISYFSDKNES